MISTTCAAITGDDVPAAHGVPAGQPVGADAAFQRRQPGHQRDQDDDPVPGQQAEDVAGRGERVAQRRSPGARWSATAGPRRGRRLRSRRGSAATRPATGRAGAGARRTPAASRPAAPYWARPPRSAGPGRRLRGHRRRPGQGGGPRTRGVGHGSLPCRAQASVILPPATDIGRAGSGLGAGLGSPGGRSRSGISCRPPSPRACGAGRSPRQDLVGSITTPLPITQVLVGRRIPEGIKCRTYF